MISPGLSEQLAYDDYLRCEKDALMPCIQVSTETIPREDLYRSGHRRRNMAHPSFLVKSMLPRLPCRKCEHIHS